MVKHADNRPSFKAKGWPIRGAGGTALIAGVLACAINTAPAEAHGAANATDLTAKESVAERIAAIRGSAAEGRISQSRPEAKADYRQFVQFYNK